MRAAPLAVAASALALAGSAGAATAPATLRFVKLIPVQVRGTHFVSRERVKVIVVAGKGKWTRTATASAGGSFTLGFGTIAAGYRCSGAVSMRATGAFGDRAVYTLPPLLCAAAGSSASVSGQGSSGSVSARAGG
jgi:hypothetical protein